MSPEFRPATEADLPDLVKMLADDELGATREDTSDPLNRRYVDAFRRIDSDPNNELTVAEQGGELVGMLQLTFIPYLTHTGSWRCLIEGVRVSGRHRGQGLGTTLLKWAIGRAAERGCSIVQLNLGQAAPRRAALLRSARLPRDPRRLQAEALVQCRR